MQEFFQGYVNYHTLSTFFISLVLGGMVFFMFVTTPAIFKALEGDERSRYLSAVFPMYYRNLAGLSAIAGGFIFYRVEAKWLWAMVDPPWLAHEQLAAFGPGCRLFLPSLQALHLTVGSPFLEDLHELPGSAEVEAVLAARLPGLTPPRGKVTDPLWLPSSPLCWLQIHPCAPHS